MFTPERKLYEYAAGQAPDHDPVNHPSHYTTHPSGIEVISYTRLLPFGPGNAVKYVMRREHKGYPVEDIDKAIWYLDDTIDTNLTYTLTDEMTGIVTPVIEAEPNAMVGSFLRAMYLRHPDDRFHPSIQRRPDIELARDVLTVLREQYA